MIPLNDNIKSNVCPYSTILLILVNTYIFSFEGTLPIKDLNSFFLTYGLVPVEFIRQLAADIFAADPYFHLLSNQFLHGGWLHVVSNMWFLWVFARHIESRLGHFPFLLFYMFCGIIAGLLHIAAYPDASRALIGASGAVSGILGAYIMCYPKARIKMFIPLPFFYLAELPAVTFLVLWFIWQAISGLYFAEAQEVAWWSHIGGFFAGLLFVRLVPACPD